MSSWLTGKSWTTGATATLPATNCSGCCWVRGRDTVLVAAESFLLEVDMSGAVIRKVSFINPPSATKKYESVSVVSEGVDADTIAICHEGRTVSPIVQPHILVFDLPHGTTDITFDLTGVTKLDLPSGQQDWEAMAWHPDESRFQCARQSSSQGVIDMSNVFTLLPRQCTPRYDCKDICINTVLSPHPFWFEGFNQGLLVNRDIINNTILGSASILSLIGAATTEGMTITDLGSVVIVNEKAAPYVNFFRLDLVP